MLHAALEQNCSLGTIARIVDAKPRRLYKLNAFGNTPLHSAVARGAPFEVIEFLAKKAPGILTTKNRRGNTPLHIALMRGRGLTTIKLLYTEGLDTPNKRGRVPLHLVSDEESCLFLIKKNHRVIVVDKRGRTPFYYAQKNRAPEMILSLLR